MRIGGKAESEGQPLADKSVRSREQCFRVDRRMRFLPQRVKASHPFHSVSSIRLPLIDSPANLRIARAFLFQGVACG